MYEIEYTEEAEADLVYFRKHEQALILDEVERRLRYGTDRSNPEP